MTKLRHQNMALCGAALCLLAVAIGAFGTHALKETLIANSRVDVFELANRYQFYHGLALLAFAALFNSNRVISNQATKSITLVTALMVIGTVIFSGSLYALALTNTKALGAITPIGGILLLFAWATSMWHIIKN